MKKEEMDALFQASAQYFDKGEWDAGLEALNAILAAHPDNLAAQEGVQKMEQRKRKEQPIRDLIQGAEEAIQAQRYTDAISQLNRAQNEAVAQNMLRFFGIITPLRDSAQKRQNAQKEIDEILRHKDDWMQESNPTLLRQRIDELIRKLIAYEIGDMASELQELKKEMMSQEDLDQNLNLVEELFVADDYDGALQEVKILKETYPFDTRVERKFGQVKSRWELWQKLLQSAEAAIADGRMDEAQTLLNELATRGPQNPNWRALWLRVFMERGRQKVTEGREALRERAFNVAQTAFGEAERAFNLVLEKDKFPNHEPALFGQNDADHLRTIALAAEDGLREKGQLHWDAARTAIRKALDVFYPLASLKQQPERGGDGLKEIEATLETIKSEIEDAISNIATAQLRRNEAEEAFTQKDFELAKHKFQEGLTQVREYNPELQKQLQEGSSRTEHRLAQAKKLQDQLGTTTASDEKLKLYGELYQLYPGAPGVVESYAAFLLAQAQLETGDSENPQTLERAAGYYQQLLALQPTTPHHEIARRALNELNPRLKLQTTLEEIERLERSYPRNEAPALSTLERLKELFTEALAAKPQDQSLRERAQQAEARRDALTKAETLRQDAENARSKGEWEQAVQLLTQAVSHWQSAGGAPQQLQERLQEWTTLTQQLEQAVQDATEVLNTIGIDYEGLGAKKLADANLKQFGDYITEAEKSFGNRPAGADPLPKAWLDGQAQAEEYRSLHTVLLNAQKALDENRESDALGILNDAYRQRSQDPVLRLIRDQLEKELTERARGRVDELLAEARRASDQGDFARALNTLNSVGQYGNFPEAEALTRRLEEQQKFWGDIEQLENAAAIKKASRSPLDALNDYTTALERFASNPIAIAPEIRAQFSRLLDIAKSGGESERRGFALSDETVLAQARAIVGQVQQSLPGNPQTYSVITILNSWLDLGERNARVGFANSRVELEEWAAAYQAAVDNIKSNANNVEYIQQQANIQKQWVEAVAQSVNKRLARAPEFARTGEYELALHELQYIPELLNPAKMYGDKIIGYREHEQDTEGLLERLENRAEELVREYKPKQAVNEALLPSINQVQQAYLDDNLDLMRQLIITAEMQDPDGTIAVKVWARLNQLRKQMEQRRGTILLEEVNRAVSTAETDSQLVRTAQDAEEAFKKLELSRVKVFELNSPTLEQRFAMVAGRLKQRLEEFGEVEAAWAFVEEHENSNNIPLLQLACDKLAKAVGLASRNEQNKLEAKLANLREMTSKLEAQQRALENQREAQEKRETDRVAAWESGKAKFLARDYDNARQLFEKARQLGQGETEVGQYLTATRAGELFQDAEKLLNTNAQGARSLLAQLVVEAENCPPAADIRQRAEAFRKTLEEAETKQNSINEKLRLAETDFMQDKHADARIKLNELFRLAPNHDKGTELQRRLDNAALAKDQQKKAEDLAIKEQYDSALAIAKDAQQRYPESADIQRLVSELETGAQAGKMITQAKDFINQNRFAEARTSLDEAARVNPSHPMLKGVNTDLEKGELRWRDRILKPYNDARGKQEHRRALNELNQVLERAGTSEFRARLEGLRQETMEAWADYITPRLRDALQGGRHKTDLEVYVGQLQEILALQDRLAVSTAKQKTLQDFNRQIKLRELRDSLSEARDHIDNGRLGQARSVAERVEQEAKELNEFPLQLDASDISLRLERIERENERAESEKRRKEAQTKRDADMLAVEALLQSVDSVDKLESAQSYLQTLLADPELHNDRMLASKRSQVELDIQRYRTTENALREARRNLRYQNFERVVDTLGDIEDPSPYLRDRIAYTRRVAQELRTALEARYSDQRVQLESALEVLRRISAEESDLSFSLEDAISDCQRSLTEITMREVQRLLTDTVPDTQGATRLLAEAQSKGWVPSFMNDQLREFEGRVQRLELVGEAARLVQAEQFPNALAKLEESRRLSFDQSLDGLGEAWEAMAQAWLSFREGDLAEAEEYLKRVPPSLNDEPLVVRLEEQLNRARTALSRMRDAEQQVIVWLRQTPPDYPNMVNSVREMQLLEGAPSDRVASMAQRVRQHIEEDMSQLRRNEAYDELLKLIATFGQLTPGEPTAQLLKQEVIEERQSKQNEAMTKARTALKQDSLNEAEEALQRAQALGESAATVGTMRDQVQRQRNELQQVEASIQRGQQTLADKQWQEAVEAAKQARTLSPNYAPVVRFVTVLIEALEREIESATVEQAYQRALTICDSGIGLNAERFQTLRTRIIQGRRQVYADANQAITQALQQWDVKSAQEALQQLQRADDGTGESQTLQTKVQQALEVRDTLAQSQEEGWRLVNSGKYAEALVVFNRLRERAQIFGFDEPERWHNYCTNIVAGSDSFRRENYQLALHYFQTAAQKLQQPQSPLPLLWGNRLVEERRRAVAHAEKLYSEVDEIRNLRSEASQLMSSGNLGRAQELLSQVEQRTKAFSGLLASPANVSVSQMEALPKVEDAPPTTPSTPMEATPAFIEDHSTIPTPFDPATDAPEVTSTTEDVEALFDSDPALEISEAPLEVIQKTLTFDEPTTEDVVEWDEKSDAFAETSLPTVATPPPGIEPQVTNVPEDDGWAWGTGTEIDETTTTPPPTEPQVNVNIEEASTVSHDVSLTPSISVAPGEEPPPTPSVPEEEEESLSADYWNDGWGDIALNDYPEEDK